MPEHGTTFSLFDEALTAQLDARRWYVAFSGGLDSTVLLHLVKIWRQTNPAAPELVAWHVNHGMQTAANDWETHCARLSRSWDIPFKVERAAVQLKGDGAEAAAREARYGVFEADLIEGDVLFMAHHLDDQVETFFLRLVRGAGLRGLSGMPSERSLGGGVLVRPLLDVGRAQLERYGREHQLAFISDPSNQDTELDRNYLRHEILPLLERRWSGYRRTVSRASDHIGSALATLEDHLPVPITVYSTLGDPGIPLQVLTCGPRDVSAVRLRSWLHALGLPMPNLAVLNEFLRQLHEGAANSQSRLDCGSYVLQRYSDAVYLLPKPWSGDAPQCVLLTPGGSIDIPDVGILSLVSSPLEGIALADGETLSIGFRAGGERCKPRGRAHSQSLKKLLQEKSVPTWWRERVPLLLLNDEILAVGDLWLCESSRLRKREDSDLPLWRAHWNRNTFALVD